MANTFSKFIKLTGATVMLAALTAPQAFAQSATIPTPRLKPAPNAAMVSSPIGFARLDQGRMIAAPFSELRDFAALSMRMDGAVTLSPVSPTTLNAVSASYPLGGGESTNRFDEIRLAAAAQGQRYVLIYGMGQDAQWNSFGGLALRDTGFVVPVGHQFSPKGKVKALLVGTYSGTVYGTVTSDDMSEGLTDFTRRVEELLTHIRADDEPVIGI